MTDEPRTADIRCVTNCVLLSLSSTDLDAILQSHPDMREMFQQAVSRGWELAQEEWLTKRHSS